MNCNRQSKTTKITLMLKIFKKNSNIFSSLISQQDIAIAKIMYLMKIKAFWSELFTFKANRLIKRSESQKIKPALTHFSLSQWKSLYKNEWSKKRIQINVAEMSGIAGPVKSEIGNKQRIIKDIPFKLNLKYSNIFIYNFL